MNPSLVRRIILAALLTFGLLLTLALPLRVFANGQAKLIEYEAGPYILNVGTLPSPPLLGPFHMTMTVTDASTDTLVLDADVTVTGVGPADETGVQPTLGPIKAVNNLTGLVYYDMNTEVSALGLWTFTIDVNGELGQGTTQFDLEVRESDPLTAIITLATLLVFVAILGFSVRSYLKERRRRAGLNAGGEAGSSSQQ
jgi:hypothetical protein